MSKKKLPKIIFLSLAINLLIASVYVYAQSNSVGTVDVNSCSGCLTLTAPTNLNLNSPIIFNNSEKRIYTFTNYDLDQKVHILDGRDTGNFNLDVNISKLINQADSSAELNYSDIGLLTFNNSTTSSIDGRNSRDNPLPASELDPVFRNKTSEPFNQTTLSNLIENDTHFDDYFTYFTGSASSSDTINIINTSSSSNYLGSYYFGLGLIFHFPANSINSGIVKDGLYTTNLTLTLTGF